MSEAQKTPVATRIPSPASASAKPVPGFVPEEMIPVWLWVQEHGSHFLVLLFIVMIAGGGIVMYRQHRVAQDAKASEQLAAPSDSLDTLEAAVAQCGSTPAGTALKLKLAKAYYDAGKYEEALGTYETFIKKNPRHPFVDVARVGSGFALAALNRTDDALKLFRDFQQAHPDHYLAPQVAIGEAACLTMQGKKAEAKVLLEDMRAAHRDTAWDMAGKRFAGAIDRYEARPVKSLLEQANTLAPLAAPVSLASPGPATTAVHSVIIPAGK